MGAELVEPTTSAGSGNVSLVGGATPSRRLEAGRGGRAGERYWGTLSQMRGSGAATDLILGGSLARIGVTVSFLSATPGMNSIG